MRLEIWIAAVDRDERAPITRGSVIQLLTDLRNSAAEGMYLLFFLHLL